MGDEFRVISSVGVWALRRCWSIRVLVHAGETGEGCLEFGVVRGGLWS